MIELQSNPCATQRAFLTQLGCESLPTDDRKYAEWREPATGLCFAFRAKKEFLDIGEAARAVFAEIATQAANRVRREIKDALKIT